MLRGFRFTERPVFIDLLEAGNGILAHLLDIGVQGGPDRIAVHRAYDRLLDLRVRPEIAVLPSVHSAKRIIIVAFQPPVRFVRVVHEAQHVAGQCPVRIDAFVLLLEPDPFSIQPGFALILGQFLVRCAFLELLIGLLLIDGDPFPDHLILRVLRLHIREEAADPALISPKESAKRRDRRFRIILTGIDDAAVEDNIVAHFRGCQHVSVPVQYVPSSVCQRRRRISRLGIGKDLPFVLVSAHGIDISNPYKQTN